MASSQPNKLYGDVIVIGTFFADEIILSDNSVSDPKVAAGANIAASKLEHQHQKEYAQPSASTAVAETKVVHRFRADGTIEDFTAGAVDACVGDSTITFDLHKNGVSILTAPIVVTSSLVDREVLSALIADAEAELDDVLEVVVTISAGTGTLGKGAFADVCIRERAG